MVDFDVKQGLSLEFFILLVSMRLLIILSLSLRGNGRGDLVGLNSNGDLPMVTFLSIHTLRFHLSRALSIPILILLALNLCKLFCLGQNLL